MQARGVLDSRWAWEGMEERDEGELGVEGLRRQVRRAGRLRR